MRAGCMRPRCGFAWRNRAPRESNAGVRHYAYAQKKSELRRLRPVVGFHFRATEARTRDDVFRARNRVVILRPMNTTSVICIPNERPKTCWSGALPAPLKRLLTDELQAGNEIQSIAAHNLDPEALLLVLARPFVRQPGTVQTDVRSRPATAPNAWPIEYYTDLPKCVLAACAA